MANVPRLWLPYDAGGRHASDTGHGDRNDRQSACERRPILFAWSVVCEYLSPSANRYVSVELGGQYAGTNDYGMLRARATEIGPWEELEFLPAQ